MNKKSVFITISVLLLLYAAYKISSAVIDRSIDDANKRGVELYASAIKYAYTAYMYSHIETTNLYFTGNVDDLNIRISTKVECEEKSIDDNGDVTLYGCRVENSKRKYKYIDGRVERE